jgi:hypothetical protein
MLGFGGLFATNSRAYSTTHGALRAERRAWNRQDDQEIAVVGNLACIGIGWNTHGDAWPAETAVANAREQRRIARDELLSATA